VICGCADKVEHVSHDPCRRVIRYDVALVIAIPVARRRRSHVAIVALRYGLKPVTRRNSFAPAEPHAVVAIAPVVGVPTVVFGEVFSIPVIEMKISSTVPVVIACIVMMHVAVIVTILPVNRAGTQREGKYRNQDCSGDPS